MKNNSTVFIIKTICFTVLALTAFAANSVLCRMALKTFLIDAAGFTAIRLISGTLVLLHILKIGKYKDYSSSKGSWIAGFMLFLYAITFSYAYITLDTGTGALILFGAVQITMIVISLFKKHRLHLTEWVGLFIAFIGFLYLLSPGVTVPSFSGFILMSFAGIAWGVYTVKGRNSNNSLADTAYNFFRTIPMALLLILIAVKYMNFSLQGIILAILSGGITSGIGYVIWYSALRGLSMVQAAVVQLLVPVFAALGGVIFVDEMISVRLLISAFLILGGILAVVLGRYYLFQPANTDKSNKSIS